MAGLHMRNLHIQSDRAIPLQASHQRFNANSATSSIRDAPVRSQPLSKPRMRPLLSKRRRRTAILATAEVCPGILLYLGVMRHNHFECVRKF